MRLEATARAVAGAAALLAVAAAASAQQARPLKVFVLLDDLVEPSDEIVVVG